MKILFAILTSPILLWSCGSESKSAEKETVEKNDSLPILYEFAETTDPNFCNLDSIPAGDCNGGSLYLNKKGKAVYQFYCYGQDTEYVSVGNFKKEGDKIVCDFNTSIGSPIKRDSLGMAIDGSDFVKGFQEKSSWKLVLEKSKCNNQYLFKSPYTKEEIERGGVYGTGIVFSIDTIGVIDEWEKIIK